MWLLLLIPFTVFWPVVALVAEGTALNRYRATWGREVMALLFCLIAYFVVWFVLYQLVSGISGSNLAGVVAATILSMISVIPLLFFGYKVFGVKPGEEEAAVHL